MWYDALKPLDAIPTTLDAIRSAPKKKHILEKR
jgi:hypothetical protein